MQIRSQPCMAMIAHQSSHQHGGISSTAKVVVRTEAANLAIVANRHTLAAHCRQLAIYADAVVVSHFTGPDSEEAGECYRGELHHRGSVSARERLDPGLAALRCVREREVLRINHLLDPEWPFTTQAFQRGRRIRDHIRRLTGLHERDKI